MGIKMSVDNSEIDFQVIINDSKIVGDKILKACGNIIKARVIGNLNAIRSKKVKELHMADDVQMRIVKDKYGYETVKVGGSKKTGTLWHIVNGGTFNTNATHFMDKTIADSQFEIEQLIDAEMRKQGF